MDKIMFNDQCFLTEATIARIKTMTRRKNARYRVGQIVGIAQCYRKIIEEEYLPSQIETDVCRLVRANHKGCTNKMYVSGDLMPHHIKFTGCKVSYKHASPPFVSPSWSVHHLLPLCLFFACSALRFIAPSAIRRASL